VIALTGAITALMGALIAVAQKRHQAHPRFLNRFRSSATWMLAVGVGSWVAAIFHLLARVLSRRCSPRRRLGDPRRTSRAGHPPTRRSQRQDADDLPHVQHRHDGSPACRSLLRILSKEAILHAAHEWTFSRLPLYFGMKRSVLTAFYMDAADGRDLLRQAALAWRPNTRTKPRR